MEKTVGPRRVHRQSFGVALLGVAMLLVGGRAAWAQIGSARYSSIVVDVNSGRVLSAASPDDLRHPASLTKMMTLYMLFEALRDRRLTLDELVPVSAHAASVEPSKLGLVPGSRMTVEEGILGLVTKSANDDAAALGELMGGDEDRFAQMMTLRARALGMSNTTFRNASGLPDPDQWSSARDLALLARHLIQDFPVEYRYFSVPSFVFHGQTIYNHDRMLISYPGADGLKTGYTEASGHNLVTSAVHGSVRLVGVVLGASTNPERDIHMTALLNAGFDDENAPPVEMADAAAVDPAAVEVAPAAVVTPRLRLALARRLLTHVPSFMGSAQAASLPVALQPAPRGHRRGRDAKLAPAVADQPAGRETRGSKHEAAAERAAPGWGVQLGSFGSQAAAKQAASTARHGGGAPRVTQAGVKGKPVWRVRMTGLTQTQAQGACAHQRGGCMLMRPDPEFASR